MKLITLLIRILHTLPNWLHDRYREEIFHRLVVGSSQHCYPLIVDENHLVTCLVAVCGGCCYVMWYEIGVMVWCDVAWLWLWVCQSGGNWCVSVIDENDLVACLAAVCGGCCYVMWYEMVCYG